jgi:hypothetical protein
MAVVAAWTLVGVLGLAASAAYLTRTGEFTRPWPEMELGTIAPEQGAAYVAPLGRSDLSSHETPSAARVLEDGRMLGPGNSQHAAVREQGRGRYSFWHDHVLFSASDSSDPRTNGRRYSVIYLPIGDGLARTLYVSAYLSMGAALLVSLFVVKARPAVLGEAATRGAAVFGGALAGASAWADVRILRRRGMAWRRPAGIALVAVMWLGVAALFAMNREVYLASTGQSTRLWASAPLQGFVPARGHAYVARTQLPDLSSHLEPSVARVLENGRALGPGNAEFVDVRDAGAGRYSFWHDDVIFATSDNSDPRTNGRTYTITHPGVGLAEAYGLLALTMIAGMAALFVTAVVVRTGAFGDLPVRALEGVWTRRADVLLAFSAGGLLLVPLMRTAQAPSVLVSVAWGVVFAVTLLAGALARGAPGATLTLRSAIVLLAALAGGEALLTAGAPNRWQGCRTTEPVTAWEAFCVSGDSTSYYLDYQPGSTRNPMYPWFIKALTAGTGFEPTAYRATPGALITNPQDPLFRVVRTQIVLLLAASLVLAAAVMFVVRSLLPPAILLALYDYGYFTAYELNIVLTEALVQTGLFLLVAAFLVFLWRPRPLLLLAAAAACGFVYLTRQAGAYTGVFVGVMMLCGLAQDWRRFWRPSLAAAALLAVLVSIPDLYIFAQTGSLARAQEGLQYQYRIAHAMQHANADDLALMPNPGSRAWLANAIRMRDDEHRMVDAKYSSEYDRMTYYINQNLYAVAVPYKDPRWGEKLPLAAGGYTRVSEFFMDVATPILAHHWSDVLAFSFRFWQLGLTHQPVSRVHVGPLGAWFVYAVLWLLILAFRDRYAVAAATMIAAHWGHVALASLFAVPIPRMVWASELLVALAAMLMVSRLAAAAAALRAPATRPVEGVVA